MSHACAFVLLAGLGIALPASARAQPLRSVELSWRGPADCASGADALAQAGAQLGPGRAPATPVRVEVAIATREDGGLLLQWSARGEGVSAQRTMAVASCDEARQAVALLIALAFAPDDRPVAEEPRAGGAQPPSTPAPTSPRPPSDLALAHDRSGLWLGLASGADLQALPAVMIVGAVRVGVRWNEVSLELDGFYGLPATRDVERIELRSELFAVGALDCRGLGLGRWELGLCAGLELLHTRVELRGADAGGKSWLRLALEPRAWLWLLPELAVGLSARGLLAPDPPRFSNPAGDRAQPPNLGVLPLLGVSWHPG